MKTIIAVLSLFLTVSCSAITVPINMALPETADTVVREVWAGPTLINSLPRYQIGAINDTIILTDNALNQVVYKIWYSQIQRPAGTTFFYNLKQAYSTIEQWPLHGLYWAEDVLGSTLETGYEDVSLSTTARGAGRFDYDTTVSAYSRHLNWARLTLTFPDGSQGSTYYYWNMKDTGSSGTIVAPTPRTCIVYGFVTDVSGNFVDLATVTVSLPDGVHNSCDSTSLGFRTVSKRTDRTGRFQIPVVWSSCFDSTAYNFEIKKDGYIQPRSIKILVPDSNSYKITF